MQTTIGMRIVGLFALIGLSILGACTNGSSQNDPTGRTCTTNFTLTGSFTATQPRPADNTDGCWPIGTWKFTAAIDTTQDNTCSPAPMPLAGGYQMEGTLMPDMADPQGPPDEVFTYDTDPNAMNMVKVTEGGAGSCAGELDLWDAACTHIWIFQPETDTIDPMTTISGQGEYSEFASAHCPTN